MKQLEVNGKLGHYFVNLPTTLNEITAEWLTEVSANIRVAPNYALIGLIYKDTLAGLINGKKKKGETMVNVSPVFVKSDNVPAAQDVCFAHDIKCNTPIVIAPSDISIGHHVVCPRNSISPNKVYSLVSTDNNIYREALVDTTPIYLIEFKIVPNCSIHGAFVEYEKNFTDNFIVPAPVSGGEA